MTNETAGWWELISRLPAVLNAVLAQTHFRNLGGLLVALENSGLGAQVKSWLGSGTNIPISQDQLKGVLNDEHVQDLARRLGVPVDEVLKILAGALPDIVNKASPNGIIGKEPYNG